MSTGCSKDSPCIQERGEMRCDIMHLVINNEQLGVDVDHEAPVVLGGLVAAALQGIHATSFQQHDLCNSQC